MPEPLTDTILLVEDEPVLSDALKYHLEREEYVVHAVADGLSAWNQFHKSSPSLVLLDLMIPEIPGLELCRLIRAESTVPIIVVTAKDSEADKMLGLELGADDYLTKPFSVRELIARVRANLRRASLGALAEGPVVRAGPVTMDLERHEVQVGGRAVILPPKEFALLQLLMERRGRLLSRSFLIDEVWGSDFRGVANTLDVHISRIREKVEDDPHRPRHILTARGLGYKFQE